MIYFKPKLRQLHFENEMICSNGTNASGSGCTSGSEIDSYCDMGSHNTLCLDGSLAGECINGEGPTEKSYYTRCQSGTAVS